jgi:excisionase family DNA binding protein
MNNTNQGFKTEREVLQYLKISRTTAWKLRKSGQLRAYRIGNTIRYADSDIAQFLSELKQASTNSVGATK